MSVPRQRKRRAPAVPAPEYRETDVRALMKAGHDPAVAVYRAWCDYLDAVRAYVDAGGTEPHFEGNPLAEMASKVRAT